MAARPDRRETLKASGLPILIVAADTDVVIPTQMQADMAKALGADYVEIAGGGHMLPVEEPKALADAVTHWLSNLK